MQTLTDNQPPRSHRTIKKKNRPKTEILFHFQHPDWPQLPHQKTVLILSKIDIIKNKILKTEEKLELSNNSHLIKRAEDHTIYTISGFLPNAYHLSIFSQNRIKTMSLSDYLKNEKNWNQKNFEVKTGTLLPGIQNILSRFEIQYDGDEEMEEGLIIIDYDWTFKIPEVKKEVEVKKENKKRKKKVKEEKKKEKGKLNRLHQVYSNKKKEKIKSLTKSSLVISKTLEQSLVGSNLLGISYESEDDYEDERLEIGTRLKAHRIPENQMSYLNRFLFFELVLIDESHSFKTNETIQARNISKDGLFEDSNVIQKGRLNKNQRVTFTPGKYILTISSVAPETFPEHDINFKLTLSNNVNLRQMKDHQVADFVGNYSPNKYFSIFHDKLLFNEDLATLSFHLKLFEKVDKSIIKSSEKKPSFKEIKKSEKRRKKMDRDMNEYQAKDFDLSEYQDISDDVHIILELYYRDRLYYRFGGRKCVNTSSFVLHKKGPEKSESLTKTNVENEIQENTKNSKKSQKEFEENIFDNMEVGFKFPTRMMSKTITQSKKNGFSEEKKMDSNNTVKTNRTWSIGEWTIKAFLDPRKNEQNYSHQKENGCSNSYKAYILDPEKIKYYDLTNIQDFKNQIIEQVENEDEMNKNPNKKMKGRHKIDLR
jgi:hypothetical protein